MTDTAPPTDRLGVPALISYFIVGMFALTGGLIFQLIHDGIEIKPVILGVLGGWIGVLTTATAGVIGYWTGSSNGSKTANAALAQLAGAGAPPPAQPLDGQHEPDEPK